MILWCQGLWFDWSCQLYKPSRIDSVIPWLPSFLQCPNFLMLEHNTVLIKKGIPRNLCNWVVLSELQPCACELLGCVNGEGLKWGNVGVCFLRILVFIIWCWFCRTRYFYPSVSAWTHTQKLLEYVVPLQGMGGGCLFLGFFLLFLEVDVIPCSSSSLFSCDSGTQSSSGALIF